MYSRYHLILLGSLLIFLFPAFGVSAQEIPDFRILVTNDDGIDAPGIAALVDALSPLAEVTVVAPSSNRSGSSHSVDMAAARETRVTRFQRDGRFFGYAVDGTPADAVRFGLLGLDAGHPFDLVVSGINRGENVGFIAHVSGTVGAAMEALGNGVSALAVSQSAKRGDDYETTAELTARIVAQVRDRGLPPRVMLSINVPAGEIRGVLASRMAESEVQVGFSQAGQEGDTTVYRRDIRFVRATEGGDTQAFMNGYVTVTPLRFDWTDYQMLGVLGDWNLSRLATPSEPAPAPKP